MWNLVDRRVERSTNLDTALTLLLRAQRTRGDLDAIVLTTADGVVVAYDGPVEDCEELAAYAPLLCRGQHLAIDARRLRAVTVHTFKVGRQDLVLTIRGGHEPSRIATLAHASMQGARRILQG